MSRALMGTPSKPTIKKAQTALKVVVASYVSLVKSWATDVESIMQLLEHSILLSTKRIAIDNACSRRSLFTRTVDNYGFVCARLISSVVLELESMYQQIRTFQKRMIDTHCAMTMACEDAMKVVLNESPELFEDDAAYTVDHALDIQQLHRAYSAELDRKTTLLQPIYGRKPHGSDSSTDAGWSAMPQIEELRSLSIAQLESILRAYPDTAPESFIPIPQVEIFLKRNKGSTEES